MRIKKGELTKEVFKILMYDLECLDIPATTDNKYHRTLLKNNLRDLFGKSIVNKYYKEEL